MNIKQLRRKLEEHFKKENYPIVLRHPWDLFKFRYLNYFEVMLPGESYCLKEINHTKWKVYYTERGSIFDVEEFSCEKDACEYFYNWLIYRNAK